MFNYFEVYRTSENNVGVLHAFLVPVGMNMEAIFKVIFFGIDENEQYNNFKKTHNNHVYHPKNGFVDKKFGF